MIAELVLDLNFLEGSAEAEVPQLIAVDAEFVLQLTEDFLLFVLCLLEQLFCRLSFLEELERVH